MKQVREVSSPDGLTFLSVLRKPAVSSLVAQVPSALRQHEAELNRDKLGGAVQRIDAAQVALTLGRQVNETLDIHFAFVDLQHRVTHCSVCH